MFTASSIVHHYETFIFPAYSIDEVIIGGGGSYNNTLMNMIKPKLGKRCSVYTQEEIGMSSEAKEAVALRCSQMKHLQVIQAMYQVQPVLCLL